MLAKDITLEQIAGVFRIYEKVMRMKMPSYARPEEVFELIQNPQHPSRWLLGEGWRVGSWWGQSKIRFPIERDGSLKPKAYANIDRDDPYIKSAERAELRFEREVQKYFENGFSPLLIKKPKKLRAKR